MGRPAKCTACPVVSAALETKLRDCRGLPTHRRTGTLCELITSRGGLPILSHQLGQTGGHRVLGLHGRSRPAPSPAPPSRRSGRCDLFFASFRLPAGSISTTAFEAQNVSNGLPACRSRASATRRSILSSAGAMSRKPCPKGSSGVSAPMRSNSRFRSSMRHRS